MKVFVDTSGFKAVIDSEDEFHSQAVKIWQELKDKQAELVTSNYILDETFTLLRAKCGLESAIMFKKVLVESQKTLTIYRVTVADEADAWNWFIKKWSKLSFTDCVSFAMMERLNIKEVVSFDNHFTRAGFDMNY
jgi:uncharacterized protein